MPCFCDDDANAKAESPPTGKAQPDEQIINYIHMHYHEDILLEELAKTFFISPYHLCREFKRYTNSTVVQYVNITRIMNAQRKFMETDKNITEISKRDRGSRISPILIEYLRQ